MATDQELIYIEVDKIRKRYNIDIDGTSIILEVLKQFNGAKRTFFDDIDSKIIREFLFNKEKQKVEDRLYKLTGRYRHEKHTKTIQETPEWQNTMHGYFSS